MKKHPSQWTHREKSFSAFVTGPLLSFWRQRQERQFVGKDGVVIRYMRMTAASHKKAIFIVPGRSESYSKYPEVVWDLFNCGYDIFVMDHRGQGLSGRLLDDPQLGHVAQFSDYVDDLEKLCELELSGGVISKPLRSLTLWAGLLRPCYLSVIHPCLPQRRWLPQCSVLSCRCPNGWLSGS